MVPSERYFSMVGAVAAILGLVVYLVSQFLHPGTLPHEPEVASAEYAAEPYWTLIHLVERLGILLIGAAAIALAWRLRRGVAGVRATLDSAATVLFLSVYAIFIAVVGIALGIMVNRWAGAGPDQQELLFETAFAVRQIEAGLIGIQWLLFGVAVLLFAGAFFASAETLLRLGWLNSMGWLSVVAGVGALSYGLFRPRPGSLSYR